VAEFVRRRLGPEIRRRPGRADGEAASSAGDYARLSVASAFPKLVELERSHGSLLRGLRALSKARKAEGKPREVGALDDSPRRHGLRWPAGPGADPG